MESKSLKDVALVLLVLVIGIFILVIAGEFIISQYVTGPGAERIQNVFLSFKSIEFLILGTAFFGDVILWILYIWKRGNEQTEKEQEIIKKLKEERGEKEKLGGRRWEKSEKRRE